jgi:hypothetical protein
MVTVPNVLGRMLVSTFIKVDLPAPLGPIIPNIYPYSIPKVSPFKTNADFFSYL